MNGWLFQYAYNSINNLSILFGPVCEAWNNQLITLLTGQFGDEIALGGKLTSQARSIHSPRAIYLQVALLKV